MMRNHHKRVHDRGMDKPEKLLSSRLLVGILGVVLLAGSLVALSVPVHLGDYDRWGMQIDCGTGYHTRTWQAAIDDQNDPQYPIAPAARPATSYTDQCRSALAQRRAWTAVVAIAGALILVPEVVAWTRRTQQAGTALPTGLASFGER